MSSGSPPSSSLLGALFAYAENRPYGIADFVNTELHGVLAGGLNGGILSSLEILVLRGAYGAPLRRLPFLPYLALRSLLYLGIILLVLIASNLRVGITRADIAFSLAMSLGFNLLLGVNDLLGPGVLFAFVAGRYYHPRREERILLFIDMRASTAIAERLGEERFFQHAFGLRLHARLQIDAVRPDVDVMARSGRATPIEYHHGDFLAQFLTKARTKSDDRRAIAFLSAWCDQTSTPATLEAITRKEALRFHDALPKLPGAPASPVTLNKYLGRLSVYWQWLRHRELVETDVWERIKIPEPATPHDERERPFTDEEVRKLLAGPASPPMHDLMMIATLTGARLEAIVDLRARDCEAGLFTFKPQKKEKSARGVPIHSALVDLVARRTKGKHGADDLFPEYPVPKRSTSQRERSFRASNEFTEYRRSVGVEEVVPGRRRSLVNFHSFRRYFITKAEQADQMEHIIAVVVGHKRTGMTLGRYSGGPLLEQARRCVEAVKLP